MLLHGDLMCWRQLCHRRAHYIVQPMKKTKKPEKFSLRFLGKRSILKK